MKGLHLISISILVLALILLIGSVASAEYNPLSFKDKEPNGFRDLEWGTNINSIDGMRVAQEEDGGMSKTCVRDDEKLQIGGAKLESIAYYFWNDKLESVLIIARGYRNCERLKETTFQAFGMPCQLFRDHYCWRGEKTNITLSFTDSDFGILLLSSIEVNEQRETYELELAKKGAQEDF